MMITDKISVFSYIDRACEVLDENASGFSHAAERLTEYLQNTFGGIDATIGITSRIKTRDSLKEKILRNHLYNDFPADRLVFEMHDIIGVRLECRFFKDEAYLYFKLREIFNVALGDGTYCPQGKKAIRLKLDAPQPEKQKNGFNIYRIDGSITYAGENYNFELQIKSLVNSFWSEIEHKLIYKNIRYNQSDNLMKELLNSIHESLTGVDHQLNLIFDRFAGNAIENQRAQLENMLALALNEIYTAIIRSQTGIAVSITDYSEAVVIYLLSASSYMQTAGDGLPLRRIVKNAIAPQDEADNDEDDEDVNYSGVLISLMEWLRGVDYNTIAIGEKFELAAPDGINGEIARVFLRSINDDFYLNTFFHIFFSIERGSDAEDFSDYITYYANRILAGKTQQQIYRTINALNDLPAHKLPLESTIVALAEIR